MIEDSYFLNHAYKILTDPMWWTTILVILGGYVGFMIFVGIKAHHEWKRKFKKK